MAGYQSAEAYDFTTFEPRNGSAARKVNNAQPAAQPQHKKSVRPNPHLRVVDPNAPQTVMQQQRVSTARVVVILCCCAVMFSFIAMFINKSVRSTELMSAINQMQVSIEKGESESVRLNTAIDSMFSIANVEAYATNVLGMTKMGNYQIQYVDLSSEDQVLYAGENAAFGSGLVERVTEYFSGLFA